MKKFFYSIILGSLLLLASGCNNLENASIYTTTYPIEYLATTLYSNHSTSSSIYPDGAIVDDYTLTEKQIDNFSKGTLFIYNGTTSEKQIANTLVKKNKNLKIIDAAYALKYDYGVEELWLSPSNYLMLAANIKDSLQEQIDSKYINEEIENKYKTLEETLSIMDAEIRSIAKNAKSSNNHILIADSNTFKYLENYGFKVISLEDYNLNSSPLASLKSNFKAGTYKYVLTKKGVEESDVLKDIKKDTSAVSMPVDFMNTLSEDSRKANETYLTIMKQYIANLKTITN